MFSHRVNEQTELRLIERQHIGEVFKLIEANRAYLRRWHAWVDMMRSPADIERAVHSWQQQYLNNRGFYAGIWFDGKLCGIINHINVDWVSRWTILSYWLAEAHQGKGIMTECCRAFLEHSFNTWNLNRVTIECATENKRSRAIPERLGFTLEGILREVEWLHDHHADHALYGLLKADFEKSGVAGNRAEHAGKSPAIPARKSQASLVQSN